MKTVHVAIAAGLIALLSACGGGSSTSTTSSTTTTTTASTPEATTSAPTTTASAPASTTTSGGNVIKMGSDTGQLVFVPAKLTVKPGDKIVWEMNKAGPHNAVFDGTEPDAATAKAIAEPKLLNKPGDKIEVTVPANAKPGDYSYHCVPHKSAGMVGVITVAK
ncbi:plastocyanin [Gloeobacter kilaueensis]|uniref:Plastocyanin n=1 Tax=Gloeobacter kilaueensis (strain ATCC BAA-2537 / CCAP 1431/1 / ULC 316 / JS1) TaxID=1183438 RepID=U5QLX2_GLOK1|nr:plastocyanin [Gloeobacter kilaueensis]AGY59982.1 plastocyanin [Gloeobacter kilaueensis JS1]